MPQRESEKQRKPRNVRLSDDEQAEIAMRAAAAGYEWSSYIRKCALGQRITPKASGRDTYMARQSQINELKKLGGLLKHLFVESGGYGGPLDPGAFAAVLSEMRMAAKRIEKGAE